VREEGREGKEKGREGRGREGGHIMATDSNLL